MIDLGSRDENFERAEKHYNAIIENTSNLCHELNTKDMFSVFVVFNYLLWNGYFSEGKNYSHSMEKVVHIHQNNGMSIMTNYGVCSNNAKMFENLLWKLEYESWVVEGYLPDNVTFYYEPNITDESIARKITVNQRIKSFGARLLAKELNHNCTLGIDDDKAYIFDPTNHCVFYLANKNIAEVLSGSGYFKLIINSKTPWYIKRAIEKALTMTPNSNINMGDLFRENVDLCNRNKNLLDDFFDENFDSIKSVAKYVKYVK